MPNLFEPTWDAERDEPPYRWRRAQLGQQAGARALGASLFELAPGAATFPLHAHYVNEELLLVLSGSPTLITTAGERELAPGEVVAFLPGRKDAHRLENRTHEPLRVLIVSTMLAPDIVERLEEGTFWLRDYAPGTTAEAPGLDVRVRPVD